MLYLHKVPAKQIFHYISCMQPVIQFTNGKQNVTRQWLAQGQFHNKDTHKKCDLPGLKSPIQAPNPNN